MPSAEFTAKDKTRRVMRRNLIRAQDYFNTWSKKTDPETVEKCESLLFEIKRQKTEFEQFTYEMVSLIEEEDAEDEKKKEDELFKELEETTYGIISLSGRINSYLKSAGARNPRESLTSYGTSSLQAPTADIRLPKIQIPKFDGDPRKFLKFKSLFSNIIHEDTSIPNVRKLYYLQEALEGAAEEFIRDVDMTESSYTTAWTELLNRYENKRVIIRAHLTDLFEINKIKDESGIRLLLDSVTASLRGLKGCGENPDQWSTILSFLVSSRLDDTTKRDFENSIEDRKLYPSFKELVKFLEIRASAVEERKGLSTCDKPKIRSASASQPSKLNSRFDTYKKSFITQSSLPKCHACSSHHLLIECKVFLSKSPYERYELIRKKQLCANCFGSGHRSVDCRRSVCKTCQQRHHTLLHFDRPSNKPKRDDKNADIEKSKESDSVKTCSTINVGGIVLLPTAVVQFRCRAKSGFARILTDPASEVTMITESFVRKHRLLTQKSSIVTTIEGVGNDPIYCSKICQVILRSRTSDFEMNIDCLVVPTNAVKYSISLEPIETLKLEMSKHELAEANLPYSSTDIIIGAEYVEDYLLNETINIDRVTLRKSRFGWLALGNASGLIPTNQYKTRICHTSTLLSIERYMKKLYNDEQFETELTLSDEQTKCVEHFESTHSRDPDGRFVVRLPLKDDVTLLSDTKCAAENSVNRILRRESEITEEYHRFICEYKELGHLSFVDYQSIESNPNHVPYYLPQLLVVRLDKSTTKTRVVFHASFKGRTGKSLNDILMVGPTLQLDLFDIILRFRRHNVAFAADIEKMYRQVSIDPVDRPLQKIVYRESLEDKPKIGILNTLTYGTAPASFIATRCLSVLADTITNSNPKYADAIRKDFYMDDLITGCDTVNEAAEMNRIIYSTLLSAKFPLRKYISNSDEFLALIDSNLIESVDHKSFEPGTIKVLGLQWTPRPDELGICYKPNLLPDRITKRKLLSEIASIFDLLGILSPVTIKAKLLMQQLWLEKIDWNDNIPIPLEEEFRHYHADLVKIDSFAIKRHYSSLLSRSSFELVGFCDASSKAYCAIVYIRIPTQDKKFDVSFVCAKTRVAPLKPLSIPRLELQAAHLLSKLLARVAATLSDDNIVKHAFSDSTTVLNWLNKPPETWKQFVANRVRDIQKIIPVSNWRYIRTDQNPADLGTRGISVTNFQNNPIWIEGPKLLRAAFPSAIEIPVNDIALFEQKKVKMCSVSLVVSTTDLSFIDRCSSYQRLIGSTAYVLRIITNNRPQQLQLSAQERESALFCIIRAIQQHYYSKEISDLRLKSEIHKRSSLSSLSPFIHADGVVRVGGRLRNANLSFSRTNPIILPAKSKFLELYARYLHTHYLHATQSFVVNFINSKFWIVGNLKAVVKKIIYLCVTCRRFRGKTCEQIMGQLPEFRVTVCDAFSNVGIDFAGPVECKCTNHRTTRNLKIYVAIFVCMTSRAVHIEIVSNLTTASFLDSLKRFVSRRGLPRLIISDNGRTFVGAKSYLDLTSHHLSEWASKEGITWRFIPPRAPHQGGIWEAAVKSAKFHLNRVLKGQILSFEDYTTVFTQIEAILNSRPLNYRRNCDKSVVMITPAHLAIGRPLLSTVEEPSNVAHSMGARYNAIRNIVGSFWTIWRNDYLAQLQSKSKWKHSNRNVEPGDVVLLKEDDCSPSHWPMAIVDRVYPDCEGIVRVVDVRTSGRTYRRIINKLIVLCECD